MNASLQDLIVAGYRARRADRPAQAAERFTEAVARSRVMGDGVALAKALTGLGQMERDSGNTDVAYSHYEEALAIVRTLHDDLWLAHTIRHVADILQERGLISEAASRYEEALAIYRGDAATLPLDLANAVRGFALLKERLGDDSAAKSLWREARELYTIADVQAGVDESERRIATLPPLL